MAGKHPLNTNGLEEDHLKEDPIVPGQDWAVVSFVNPEDMVVKKFLYYVNNFMVNDINKTLTASATQMAKLLKSRMRGKIDDLLDKLKYSKDPDDKHLGQILEKRYRDMELDEDEFVDECRRRFELDDEELSDRYKMFLAENRQRLDIDFDGSHDHATSSRGFKIRGSYQRLTEAKERCHFLRNEVERAVHAFVVPVGKWFPVDMEADEVQDQEYMLKELNSMMGKYHEGVHARNQHYNDRKKDMEEHARNKNNLSTKDRLQNKLRANRKAKMRREMDEHEALCKQNTDSTKKKRRPKKKKSAEDSTGSSEQASEQASV